MPLGQLARALRKAGLQPSTFCLLQKRMFRKARRTSALVNLRSEYSFLRASEINGCMGLGCSFWSFETFSGVTGTRLPLRRSACDASVGDTASMARRN